MCSPAYDWLHQPQRALRPSVHKLGSPAPSPAQEDTQQHQRGRRRSGASAQCNPLLSPLAAELVVPTQACRGISCWIALEYRHVAKLKKFSNRNEGLSHAFADHTQHTEASWLSQSVVGASHGEHTHMQALCWAKKSAMRSTLSRRKLPCRAQVIRYSVREVLRAAECTLRFTRWTPLMPTSSGPLSAAPLSKTSGRTQRTIIIHVTVLILQCRSSVASLHHKVHGTSPNLSLRACQMVHLSEHPSPPSRLDLHFEQVHQASCFQPSLHSLHNNS